MNYQVWGTDKYDCHHGYTLALPGTPGLYTTAHFTPYTGETAAGNPSRAARMDCRLHTIHLWNGTVHYRSAVVNDFGELVPTHLWQLDFERTVEWCLPWPELH